MDLNNIFGSKEHELCIMYTFTIWLCEKKNLNNIVTLIVI